MLVGMIFLNISDSIRMPNMYKMRVCFEKKERIIGFNLNIFAIINKYC